MKPPKLTVAGLDDQKIHAIIDQLLTEDRQYWRHTRRILRLQHTLQELASDDAFLAYLDVEQATNERVNVMLLAVARRAFQQGKASR